MQVQQEGQGVQEKDPGRQALGRAERTPSSDTGGISTDAARRSRVEESRPDHPIKTVPPPLLVVGVLAFVMLCMQLVSALMQFLMPVMFPLLLVNNFAPQNLRMPLMLGLVATSLATAFL